MHSWRLLPLLLLAVDCKYKSCWVWEPWVLKKGTDGLLAWHMLSLGNWSNQRSVPEGLQINHHCDNPPCCSIWHIYAGTQIENNLDMGRRGRRAVGEAR